MIDRYQHLRLPQFIVPLRARSIPDPAPEEVNLAEVEALTRNSASAKSVIDTMDFTQLLDHTCFGGGGRTLEEMRAIAAGWSFDLALKTIIIGWPKRTYHESELAIAELDQRVPTVDPVYNYAVRRLKEMLRI